MQCYQKFVNLKNVDNTHGGVQHSSMVCFLHFLNVTNATKPRKASHIYDSHDNIGLVSYENI